MKMAKDGNVSDVKLHHFLHMNAGDGHNSYANNSLLQKKILLKAKPILQETMADLCARRLPECLTFADLGCSSGPNTFVPVQEIMETIDETCQRLNKKAPMLQVLFNDLPGNDFNSIFKSLPRFLQKLQEERGRDFGPCFVSAVPGSFHGRLFPPLSVHLVHSSYSLQSLSEVPKFLLNYRQIYVTKTSPPEVHEAYLSQFEKDFTAFLRSRSEEVVGGGRMVLTIYGREENSFSSDTSNPSIWELFGTMLNDMASKGMIEESKLESFKIPFYGASTKELKNVIIKEGSFKINKIESFQIGWDSTIDNRYKELMEKGTKGELVANCLRAILESFLSNYFGEDIIDFMFQSFSHIMADKLEIVEGVYTNVVSLTRE